MSTENVSNKEKGNGVLADVSISYDDGIEELKRRYPEYKEVRFEVWNTGEISYSTSSYHESIDMNKIQAEFNEIMGMKEYLIKLKGYERCFARDEKEAKEYAKDVAPTGFSVDTIYEISN